MKKMLFFVFYGLLGSCLLNGMDYYTPSKKIVKKQRVQINNSLPKILTIAGLLAPWQEKDDRENRFRKKKFKEALQTMSHDNGLMLIGATNPQIHQLFDFAIVSQKITVEPIDPKNSVYFAAKLLAKLENQWCLDETPNLELNINALAFFKKTAEQYPNQLFKKVDGKCPAGILKKAYDNWLAHNSSDNEGNEIKKRHHLLFGYEYLKTSGMLR